MHVDVGYEQNDGCCSHAVSMKPWQPHDVSIKPWQPHDVSMKPWQLHDVHDCVYAP